MLAKLDAAIRRRSVVGWVAFRAVAGFLIALGLYAWLGIWFQRGLLLGIAQSVMCVMVLAHEFGLFRRA